MTDLPLPAKQGPGAVRQERLPLTDARRSMLAKIHVAKKQLALDEEAYRDVVRRVTGRDSAGAASDRQLDALLREFRRLGFKAPAGRGPARQPYVRMIYGIWKDLAPHLSDSSEAALRAFVRRQTKGPLSPEGVDAPEFLDGHQAARVIEGLKAWLARERQKASEEQEG